MNNGYWRITSLGIEKLPEIGPEPEMPRYVGLVFYAYTLGQARGYFSMYKRWKPYTLPIKYAAFTANKSAIAAAYSCIAFAEAVIARRASFTPSWVEFHNAWKCAGCKGLNPAGEAWCSACGNAAPPREPAYPAPKWFCTSCFTKNPCASTVCEKCGARW